MKVKAKVPSNCFGKSNRYYNKRRCLHRSRIRYNIYFLDMLGYCSVDHYLGNCFGNQNHRRLWLCHSSQIYCNKNPGIFFLHFVYDIDDHPRAIYQAYCNCFGNCHHSKNRCVHRTHIDYNIYYRGTIFLHFAYRILGWDWSYLDNYFDNQDNTYRPCCNSHCDYNIHLPGAIRGHEAVSTFFFPKNF